MSGKAPGAFSCAWATRQPFGDLTRLEPREFKTVTGLISFAVELGLDHGPRSFEEGEKATWTHDAAVEPIP